MTKQTPYRGRSEGEKILGDQLLSCQSLEGNFLLLPHLRVFVKQANNQQGFIILNTFCRFQLHIRWEISANQAGKQLGVSHKSFLRWARENEKKSS